MSKDFAAEIADLAASIAESAKNNENLETRIDALKVLTPYYALWLKARAKNPDNSGDALTFEDFADAINGAEEDNAAVRSRAERRPDA